MKEELQTINAELQSKLDGDPDHRRVLVLRTNHALPDGHRCNRGVVITFVDISTAKDLEARLRKA